MRSIRLDIEDATGTVHSYGDDALLATSESTAESISVSERTVRMADVTMWVRDPGGFMTFGSVLDVPGGASYRARLVLYGDAGERTLISGVVRSEDLEYEDHRDAWKVTLIDRAADEVWSALSAVWVDEIAWRSDQEFGAVPPQLSRTDVDLYYRFGNDGKTAKIQTYTDYPFYDLLSVVEMCLAEAATSWTVPDHAVEHKMRLSGDTVTVTATPHVAGTGFLGLPAWTAERFITNVLAYAGWWLRATYSAWPGEAIAVELATSRFESGTPTPIDDSALSRSGQTWRMRVEERSDYALQLGDGAGRASVNPHDEFDLTGSDAADRLGAPPPAFATYASPSWSVEPACIDPNGDLTDRRSPQDEDIQQIEFQIPDVVVEGETSEAVGSSTRTRVYGVPLHPDVQEPGPVPGRDRTNLEFPLADPDGSRLRRSSDPYRITGRCSPDTSVLLVETLDVGGETKVEHHSILSSPAASQHPVVSSSWAAQMIEGHRLLGSDRHILEGAYRLDDQDIHGVGTSEMVEAQGASWAVINHRFDTVTAASDIVAIRPILDDLQADYPTLPSTLSAWRILRLTVDIYRWMDGEDERDYIVVWWEPPPADEALALDYEAEFKDLTESSPTWQPYFTTYTTAYIQPHIVGGPSPAEYNFTVRVRPRTHDGQTGEWESVNAFKTF